MDIDYEEPTKWAEEPPPIMAVNLLMMTRLSPVPRALYFKRFFTWGFASLHPRLYAVARFASLESRIHESQIHNQHCDSSIRFGWIA